MVTTETIASLPLMPLPARRSAASPLPLLRSTPISLVTKRQARCPNSSPPSVRSQHRWLLSQFYAIVASCNSPSSQMLSVMSCHHSRCCSLIRPPLLDRCRPAEIAAADRTLLLRRGSLSPLLSNRFFGSPGSSDLPCVVPISPAASGLFPS